jgi:hypothetical protein
MCSLWGGIYFRARLRLGHCSVFQDADDSDMACMNRKLHFAAMAGVLSASVMMPSISFAQTFELDSTKGLQPHDVTVEAVTYQGRKAIRVMPVAVADGELVAPKNVEGGGIVVLSGTAFHNGTIDRGPGQCPMLAGSLVWPSGWPSRQSTNVFIFALPTVVPTTNCDGITRRSTSPCRSTNGRGCGKRRRDGTSHMWI